MSQTVTFIHLVSAVIIFNTISAYFSAKNFECGPYGFVCEGNNKLRLCEGVNLYGPSFICPTNTICNEDSNDVCENAINYIDPSLSLSIRCRRNERIADPNVPGCKGYILCTTNKNRFQGIKFQCSGNTIFNGYTRTCSSTSKYKCPQENETNKTKTPVGLYVENRRVDSNYDDYVSTKTHTQTLVNQARPIDCKNYKFRVTQDTSPVRAAYFCPPRPIRGEDTTRCTIFSNQFCITLERDDRDQFIYSPSVPYRKPRTSN